MPSRRPGAIGGAGLSNLDIITGMFRTPSPPLGAERVGVRWGVATGWPGAEMSPELVALQPSFRDAEETYRDTIRWLHEAGHLTAAQVGKLSEPD